MRNRFLSLSVGLVGCSLFAITLSSASCGARSSLEIPPPAPPLPKCVVDADCDGFANKCRHIHCVLDQGSGGSGGGSATSSSSGGCTECCDSTIGCPPMQGSTGSTSTSSSSVSTGSSSTVGAGGSFTAGSGSGQALTLAQGRCVEEAATNCDDKNPCTLDNCNPDSGACEYAPATHDLDHDGHNGPLEGTKAGTPGSCGDDCDDTNANAYPGNKEVCDGVDNDCNGIVDDNATFIPLLTEPKQISEHPTAEPGSLVYNGENYNATFTESTAGSNGGADMFTTMLSPEGDKIAPGQVKIEDSNHDSFGGAAVWTGDRYGVTWEAQVSEYHTFFTLLDDKGKKFLPNQQLDHNTQEFAINQDIGFTGQNFVVVWQDDRSGTFQIRGSVVGLDGTVLHPDVEMTNSQMLSLPNESPIVAASSQGIALVWARGDAVTHDVSFQRFNFDLTPIGEPFEIVPAGQSAPVYPTIIFNHDRYVVAWFDKEASPAAIYATVLDLQGNTLVPPKAVTNPGVHHSRYPYMRALGDRVLLVFADDRDGNQGYELYSRVIDNSLNPISQELRLTNAPGDSIYPRASFGPNGDVGVLFRDDRTGDQHVWFTRLGCVAGTTPPNP